MTLRTLFLCDEEFEFFVAKAAEEHKHTHIHYTFLLFLKIGTPLLIRTLSSVTIMCHSTYVIYH